MKKLYIYRHDEAARMIIAEVQKGAFGNHLICADVGSLAHVEHLDLPNNRIPKEVISDQTLSNHGIAMGDRHKIRPDALYGESATVTPPTRTRSAARVLKHNRIISEPNATPPSRPAKAMVLEFGYSSETRYKDKMDEKLRQHAQLQDMLTSEGFDASIRPVIIGTTGGIFKSSDEVLRELGVDKARLAKLNDKLHAHSINTMHAIIKLRRTKEAELQKTHLHRKKKPPDK